MRKLFLLLTVLLFAFTFGYEIKAGGMQEGDLLKFYQATSLGFLDSALDPAGLTIATSTTDVKTTNIFMYTIDGVFYTLAAQSNISLNVLAASIDTQPVSTYRKYMLSVNSSGTISVTAGDYTAYNIAKLPIPPTGYAPFAYIKVLTGATYTYDPGSTGLSGSGLTVVYKNIRGLESGSRSMDLTDDSLISDDSSDSTAYDQTIGGGDIDITSTNMVLKIATSNLTINTGNINLVITDQNGTEWYIKASSLE